MHLRRRSTRLILALFTLLSGSCGIQKMTGDVMSEYTTDEMVPYLLATNDEGMACETGVSMGAFLMSFERVTDPPHKAAIGTLLTAALCSEMASWEADLRGSRALFRSEPSEAQDARVVEKRAHAVTAARYYGAWKELVAQFGQPGDKCPDLAEEDELFYMLGLLSGVQAVSHDRAAGGAAGVPLDVPRNAARATECLNNSKWWGVPGALKAAVWLTIPGAAPEGVDPWAILADSQRLGREKKVRLASAIRAQSLAGAGKTDELRALITEHAAELAENPADPAWRLLDRNGTLILRYLSDRLWTEAKGYRTPFGQFGEFWDEEDAGDGVEIDDGLLEGLE